MATEIKVGQTVAANYFRGIESVGGKLLFDEKAMVFTSHALNVQTGTTSIDYTQIVSTEKKTFGLFPTGLVVNTKDGKTHTFVIYNRDSVIRFIQNRKQQLSASSEEPAPAKQEIPTPKQAPKSTGQIKLNTYDGPRPYLFISYAHADSKIVLPIIAQLQNQGFRIWFDQGIEVGTEWPEYIAEHLEKAANVIVFMSKAAAESKNCRREINFSIDINKEPIVVYLEDVVLSPGMKLQLNTLQAIFKYRSNSENEFFEELCRAKSIQNCRN